MEKSIETIWQEGFLKADALIAPQINNLYDRKSKHIIDKLKNMFRINLIAIVFAAFIIGVIFIYLQVWWAGLVEFGILLWLAWFSKTRGQSLDEVNKGQTSYAYLTSFHQWIAMQMDYYGRLYQFVYPPLISAFCLGILYAEVPKVGSLAGLLLSKPGTWVWEGMPIAYVGGCLIYGLMFGIFAKPLFRLDVKMVYGPVMKKLERLINDMEEIAVSEQS